MQISYSSSPAFNTLKISHQVFRVLGLSGDIITMTTFIQSIIDIDTSICMNFCRYIYLYHRQDHRVLDTLVTKHDTSDYVILSIRKEK